MWPSSRLLAPTGRAASAVGIDDLRRQMHRRLPAFVTEYIEGGADAETALRRNVEAFATATLLPRMLVDVSAPDPGTALWDTPLPFPLVIAPTGLNGYVCFEGDRQLARAASSAGVPFTQSMVSMSLLEDVATDLRTPHWMQLYVLRDRAFTEDLLARALKAECAALVVTVDGAVYGNRPWEKRHYRRPAELDWRSKWDILGHPRWLADIYRNGKGPRFVNVEHYLGRTLSAPKMAGWLREQMDATLSWDDLRWLRARWPRKLIVKGVLAIEDVQRAIDCGADGIVLSNHGGRQLDLAPAPLDQVPAAAARCNGRVVLLVDGGIRRGSDIAQAVARGADAVMTGRATLYGLGAGGEAGASRALAILREEFVRTMALLGCRSVAEMSAAR
ncbi:alpha-hydroxy acid oxidase [Robbsia sp. KACC 23696]|uniref:alpha-hydroxy acid oxidase n=1 Tax=Robbsia sp. KACC 23696 TaxID=3149231 RepID=UPI00325B8204